MSDTGFTVRVEVGWNDGTRWGARCIAPEVTDPARAYAVCKNLLDQMRDELFWNFEDRYPGQRSGTPKVWEFNE